MATKSKSGSSEAAALGFRAHSGWAVVVAVTGSPGKPVVLERRRIVIADAAIRGSKQPYHAAESLGLQEAEALIGRCRESSEALASVAVQAMVERFAETHRLVGSGLLIGSGRTLPELAAILRSHPLLHTAEGEFYREVLASGSERWGLRVERIKEREVWERGAAVLQLPVTALQQRVNELGRSLGPPWTQDEKLAALAAWIVLAG